MNTNLKVIKISKALEKSIAMANVRSGAWDGENPGLYYVREGGGRKRWSGWDGSHVGWVKMEGSSVLDTEGVPVFEQHAGRGRK